MKIKLTFTLFLLTAILSLAVVSADVIYVNPIGGSLTTLSTNGDPSTQVTILFRLKNLDNTQTATNISPTLSDLISSTDSTKKIPSTALSLSSYPSSIGTTSESATITLTANIPANQLAGLYTGILRGSGKYGTSSISFDIPLSITVNPKPSLTVSSSTISDSANQTKITVSNNGNVDFSVVNVNIPEISGATFSPSPSSFLLNTGESKEVIVSVVSDSRLKIGLNDATVRASANDGTSATGKITIEKTFCKFGEKGTDLEITDVRIDNSDGDDEEWSPLDQIEIKVEVSNNKDIKIKDVFVEIGLFNSEGKNVIKNMDNLNNRDVDLGSIKDGDKDTATFKFTVPADFEDDNYKLVIKSYSKDIGESELCTSSTSELDNNFFQSIDGERETDEEKHVVFNNIKITPSPAQCGEKVQLTGEIFNIGDEDYKDQVKVTLLNKELGLNLEKVVKKDLDQGDSEIVDFEFDIPKIDEKIYVLEFKTYYDYDEDDDDYDRVSEDKFTASLRVEGNCKKELKSVQITAELDSETPSAVAGQKIIVNAKLKNTGDVETTYAIGISENSEWSTLESIEPRIVSLSPGDSKIIIIALNLAPDVLGNKEFMIKTSYDGLTTDQKVAINVFPKTETQLTPVVEHLRSNWFIYLIILVNIILVIAIILVIRSMVTPRAM